MLRTLGYGETNPGRVRDHNEDSFVADASLGLFLVADGVGGGNAGEVASEMLTQLAYDEISEFSEGQAAKGSDSEREQEAFQSFLPKVIERASEAIYRRGQDDPSCRGMATTAVLVKVLGSRAIICHVGDSRLYLMRADKIYQITQDHSLARELVEKGVLKQEEVPSFRYRNVILRSVGIQPTVQIDTLLLDLLPGDLLLLCSDGLSDMIDGDTIQRICRGKSPRDAVPALVAAANEAGGHDNITAVMLQVLGSPPPAEVMATERKASFLTKLFLFRDLSFAETLKVMQCVQDVGVREGEPVIRQGEDGDRLFLVTSGSLQVIQDGVPLTRIGPGGHFGELSLLERGARSADVMALETSTLLSISRDDFFDLLQTDHTLATKLLWRFLQNTGRRVRMLSNRVSHLVRELQAAGLDPGEEQEDHGPQKG